MNPAKRKKMMRRRTTMKMMRKILMKSQLQLHQQSNKNLILKPSKTARNRMDLKTEKRRATRNRSKRKRVKKGRFRSFKAVCSFKT